MARSGKKKRRSRKGKKITAKAVRRIAKSVLRKGSETKESMVHTGVLLSIRPGNSYVVNPFWQLLKGTFSDERIGDLIQSPRLRIDFSYEHKGEAAVAGLTWSTSMIRIMVLRASPKVSTVLNTFSVNPAGLTQPALMKDGLSTNSFGPLNTNYCTVLMDRKYNVTDTGSRSGIAGAGFLRSKAIRHTLRPKMPKRWQFDAEGAAQSFGKFDELYVVVWGYVEGGALTDNIGNLHITMRLSWKDS